MINTLKNIYNNSLIYVDENNVSKKDIEYLLKETFSLTTTDFILKQNECFDDEIFLKRFEQLKEGKPVEYVLGYSYFCNLKFEVTQDTLIPRSETEDLVLLIKEMIDEKQMKDLNILDIGSGSGCIPITLNKFYSNAHIESVDISKKALKISQNNNVLNKTKVDFYHSDCFENVKSKFDIIVSNPPYIDRETYVQESVIKYEPHLALFADNHGLAIYEKILKEVNNFTNEGAIIAFEISPDLEEGLIKLIEKYLNKVEYSFKKDINGFLRYLFIFM